MSAKEKASSKQKGKENEKELKSEKAESLCESEDNKPLTELEVKEQQFAELSDKFMRLAAEYDNFRRRSQKEKEGIYSDCIASVVMTWLPVIDNLERASFVSADYESEEAKKINEGIRMILTQIQEVLTGLGVTEIEARSAKFDPNTMDAVMHVDDEKAGESEVIEVFTKGYTKGDKVIRHAIVKVAN